MREAVAKPLRDAAHTFAVGTALVIILILPYFIPPSFFMTVHELRFVETGSPIPGSRDRAERDKVLQSRSPRWKMRLEWSALVYEAFATDSDSGKRDVVLVSRCNGNGVWTYKPMHQPAIMPLETWVGDKACRLGDGTYMLYAQWTYRFLIWSWTVDARSALFTIKGRG